MPTQPASVSFSSFVTSLFVSALHYLGQSDKEPEPRLMMARQTIDLLEVLRTKTKGNLDEEEAKHLDQLIAELQLKYVQISQAQEADTAQGPPSEGAGEE
jgi:hypothetical protein